MQRIGILTFWGVPNCGTFAQAYALRNVIQEICKSREVFQIAYLNEIHKNFYDIGNDTAEEADKKRNDMFMNCYNRIPHINVRKAQELLLEEQIDTLILGSDIIWDFSMSVFGDDSFLFGNKINANYKFSYAPSFGTCKSEWKRIPQHVTEGLRELDSISVRDNNSVQIVKNISGKKAELVLDPVWLWDWRHDDNIIEPKIENYIFVYGGVSKEFQANLRNWAVEHDCVIIAYGSRKDDYSWCDVALDTASTTPFEVFGYFKNARVVATSTFHGMIFSLVFGKKVAYYKTDFIEAKIHDFLCEIGIGEKYLNGDDVYNMYETKWDYERIYSIIENKKDVSLKYLTQNLRRIRDV